MKFLIIEPCNLNGKKSGRGARGKNLKFFLDTYFGRGSAKIIDYKKLHGSNSFSVDHLFIGIPSALSANDLKRISSNKIHLFDYGDNHCADWGGGDPDFFLSFYHSYLKPWVQEDWGDDIRWGLLPIRRNRSISLTLAIHRLLNTKIYGNSNHRKLDTSFLGNPVVGWREKPESVPVYIRVDWLEEISRNESLYFDGGFFMKYKQAVDFKEKASTTLKPYFLNKGRVNFFSYFNLLINSKTALVPPGNALWSYRHYESIYAGCIPITADFTNAKMLIPMPLDGMIHIQHGGSIVQGVEEAMQKLSKFPDVPWKNLVFIEQYLTNGLYDNKKRRLLDRFMNQLERK